jgi:hypothetical protein
VKRDCVITDITRLGGRRMIEAMTRRHQKSVEIG